MKWDFVGFVLIGLAVFFLILAGLVLYRSLRRTSSTGGISPKSKR